MHCGYYRSLDVHIAKHESNSISVLERMHYQLWVACIRVEAVGLAGCRGFEVTLSRIGVETPCCHAVAGDVHVFSHVLDTCDVHVLSRACELAYVHDMESHVLDTCFDDVLDFARCLV